MIEHEIDAQSCVRAKGGGSDAAIAELADRQHGVVGRFQLIALGLGRGAIGARLKAKRLHVVYRGAYAVGRRRIDQRGVWMAAVLACGPDAVLSHRSAAALWGLRPAGSGRVDVTLPRRLRPHDGIRPHRADLPEDERAIEAGIPVTSVSRTLLDLAATLQPDELTRALEQAEALRLQDELPVLAAVQRHTGRRGAGALATALAQARWSGGMPKSELEARFLAFLDDNGLPRPRLNKWIEIGGELIEADCVWPEHDLLAEIDSRAWHETRAAFERDRKRDRQCVAAGWRGPIRVTHHALTNERAELRGQLRSLLSAAVEPKQPA